MATKIIYFVRHGETILNAAGIRQGADGSLSEAGKLQVQKTAEAFKHEKKFTTIIASPFQRTKETATILADKLKLAVEYCDLLVERKNPTEIIGKNKDDVDVKIITDKIDGSFHEDDFRYSDEENFSDLKVRSRNLLEYISQKKESRLLMVTHGIFLKMFISYMLYGEKMTERDYALISYESAMDNAGVTICSYTTYWFKKSEWRLLLWNGVGVER